MTPLHHFNDTVLSNGLRVVTDYQPHAQSVTLGFWNDCGARFETEAENGLSHFLEHMVFKGTTHNTALALANKMDAIGGQMNAYTAYENTAYFTKILSDYADDATHLMADIMAHSTFPVDEIQKEQGVVIQEIGMYKDTPDDHIFDLFHQQVFGNHPLGRTILGTVETVSSFDQTALRGYFDRYYHTQSMVCVAAGAIDHDAFCAAIEKSVGHHIPAREKNKYTKAQYQGGICLDHKKLEQMQIMLGYESIPYDHDDYAAATLACAILGGGDSSRINQEVREKRGLAYSTYAYQAHYLDTGFLAVYAGTGPDEAKQTFDVMVHEFKKMADGVTDEELKRAKVQLRAALLMASDDSYHRADRLGRSILTFGHPKSMKEFLDKMMDVSAHDIQRFMTAILSSPPTIAVHGNVKKFYHHDYLETHV